MSLPHEFSFFRWDTKKRDFNRNFIKSLNLSTSSDHGTFHTRHDYHLALVFKNCVSDCFGLVVALAGSKPV